MRLKFLTAVALLVSGSAAQAAPEDQSLSVTVSAGGASDVWCHVTPNAGSDFVRYFRPGAPFTSASVHRATCSYKNSTAAPISITIKGDAWACPFPVAGGGACTKEIEARDSGDFALKRKHV